MEEVEHDEIRDRKYEIRVARRAAKGENDRHSPPVVRMNGLATGSGIAAGQQQVKQAGDRRARSGARQPPQVTQMASTRVAFTRRPAAGP